MKLQVFGVMILEKDLTKKLMKAHSVDDTLHRKDISYVGEIQRGDRLYKLYVSPSPDAEERRVVKVAVKALADAVNDRGIGLQRHAQAQTVVEH